MYGSHCIRNQVPQAAEGIYYEYVTLQAKEKAMESRDEEAVPTLI
jgi:hypothetical protein